MDRRIGRGRPTTHGVGRCHAVHLAGAHEVSKQDAWHARYRPTWAEAHTIGLSCPPRLSLSLTDYLLVAVLCHSSPEALLLSSALFLWQFPHFFALSWVHRKDYARGGFQMVPCNDPTGTRTADLILRYAHRVQGGRRKGAWLQGVTGAIIMSALQWRLPISRPAGSWAALFLEMMCRYSAYMAPLPIVASALGVTGSMFALEGSALNAYLLYLASKFQKDRTTDNARAVFRCAYTASISSRGRESWGILEPAVGHDIPMEVF